LRHIRQAVLPAVALAALIPAGCGSDDNNDKQSQTSTPAASSTPRTAQGDTASALAVTSAQTPFRPSGKAIRRSANVLGPKAAGGGPSTYCSPTGDYCVGVGKRGSTALLSIATLAFKGSYRLCIAGPGGRGCKSFALRRSGQMYASTVAFTPPSRGRWTASWFYGSTKLGKSLSFLA
jgi:hypothetical protein